MHAKGLLSDVKYLFIFDQFNYYDIQKQTFLTAHKSVGKQTHVCQTKCYFGISSTKLLELLDLVLNYSDGFNSSWSPNKLACFQLYSQY